MSRVNERREERLVIGHCHESSSGNMGNMTQQNKVIIERRRLR